MLLLIIVVVLVVGLAYYNDYAGVKSAKTTAPNRENTAKDAEKEFEEAVFTDASDLEL